MSVALAQPHRRGDDNPLRGFALGRLRLQGLVTQDQYIAGGRFGRLAIRHGRLVTGMVMRFPAPVFDMAGGGLDCRAEPEDDQIFEIRRAWGDAQAALLDARDAFAANSMLTRVCVMDVDPTQHELGSLREALNVLHNLWR